MRRRDFIKGIAVPTVAWPLAARAQQSAAPVIGLLSQRSHDESTTALQIAAFRRGLKEVGFEEGRNVTIEYRWAAGHYDQLPAFAADLVRRKVAVIVAHASTNAVLAAKAATSTIPIVFVYGGDPIKQGVVASLNHPGGNITGVGVRTQEILAKRFELLVEIIPNVTTIGVLINAANASAEIQSQMTREAARSLGRKVIHLNASSESEIEKAFTEGVLQQVQGVVITSDPLFNAHAEVIAAQTAHYMVPAIAEVREFPAAGGLLSYGTNFDEANRVVGVYVGRILRGEKPADLPVQLSTKLDFVINLKTAKALGITIPLALLGRADEVIE